MAKRRKRKRSHPKELWEAVKADYRLGILSIRAIAEKHGIDESSIRERARKEEWQQDLAHHVEARRRALLLPVPRPRKEIPRDEQPDPTPAEEELINDAARTQIGVVLEHRKDIREARGILHNMMEELAGQTFNRAAVEELVAELRAKGDKAQAQMALAIERMCSLGARATTMVNLVNALGKLTTLERQAFGLGNLETDAAIDPVKRDQEQQALNQVDGRTDVERASAILSFIDRATRAQTNPGNDTKQ
jgi:hypothetical protein